MRAWMRTVAAVVLLAQIGCAGWRYGPPLAQTHQALSAPHPDHGQRFDLFIGGLGMFAVSYLLLQLPIAYGIDDWMWAVPVAGPFIRWEATARCPEGTNCMGTAINVLGLVVVACELAGLGLGLAGLLMSPPAADE